MPVPLAERLAQRELQGRLGLRAEGQVAGAAAAAEQPGSLPSAVIERAAAERLLDPATDGIEVDAERAQSCSILAVERLTGEGSTVGDVNAQIAQDAGRDAFGVIQNAGQQVR